MRCACPSPTAGRAARCASCSRLVIRLAAADSNVAQSLRAHFHFVEARLAAADERERERWLPEVVEGLLFGNATVERTTRDMFGFETKLTRDGEHYRLRGTKYYSHRQPVLGPRQRGRRRAGGP